MNITPSGQACGATVTGVDLTGPLSRETVADIRAAWLEHHVLAFPDQAMSNDDLEEFTLYFGPFGDDPFIAPIPGRDHIIAVKREADETSGIFAEVWHTDWSFQQNPPSGTCLFGITIPPEGGDTLYANQHMALDEMPERLRRRLEGMDDDEANALLVELYHWQSGSDFQYRHRWQPDMLVIWDNRSVLHTATGGYEGHARLLHRTTIGAV